MNGGQYANRFGEIDPVLNPRVNPPTRDYPLWDSGSGGFVNNCEFPLKLVAERGGTAVSLPDVALLLTWYVCLDGRYLFY